jgi:hypothetical protein
MDIVSDGQTLMQRPHPIHFFASITVDTVRSIIHLTCHQRDGGFVRRVMCKGIVHEEDDGETAVPQYQPISLFKAIMLFTNWIKGLQSL